MSLKLALLLLFGFVALAVAVPLEDTEEKTEPVEPVAADAENPEAPLKEFEDDESENDNQEDAEEEPEEDDNNEEEPEKEVEANDEDGIVKRLYLRRCVIIRRKCLGITRCSDLSLRPWQYCCLQCRPINPIKKCLYCLRLRCSLIGCRYYGCFWRVVN